MIKGYQQMTSAPLNESAEQASGYSDAIGGMDVAIDCVRVRLEALSDRLGLVLRPAHVKSLTAGGQIEPNVSRSPIEDVLQDRTNKVNLQVALLDDLLARLAI